ncbi:hypothetical protein ABI_26390 [Asticcacaulis biprosthecium C19]|uniref:Uncharacterized protein n=1 Tax=Asticcacaulis biprosthecium C19 TaxID=715226 RepID=F4QPG6_9CAUL|nr:hypothetical protein [Asticcacaulis biprosthecium]EGF91224.1 hypothetical protein ABI_26390 [Asticcacaulis biprosthecium C19]
METSLMSGQMGSSLSVAVDRLDRALEALESRVRALQNGDPLPPPLLAGAEGAPVEGRNEEVENLLNELEEAKGREAALAKAAETAFQALGMAAANIRILLREEAA